MATYFIWDFLVQLEKKIKVAQGAELHEPIPSKYNKFEGQVKEPTSSFQLDPNSFTAVVCTKRVSKLSIFKSPFLLNRAAV